MKDIYLLLDHLKSAELRIEACNRLRRASSLSPEAINALKLTTHDPNPRVVQAARTTLLVHRLRLNKIPPGLGWAALIGIGLLAFLYIIKDTLITESLTCMREQPGSGVNCVEQPYYFYLIPLPTREIHDVRGVDMLVITDNDDLELYNLKLITADGSIELYSGYSYHYPSKRVMADQLTALIRNETETSLDIYDRGYLNWWTVFFLCGPEVAIVLVYCLIRGVKKLREKKLSTNFSDSIKRTKGSKGEASFGGHYE